MASSEIEGINRDEPEHATHDGLLHDWNQGDLGAWPALPLLVDETLRDGLQSPSAHDPPLEKKLELLHMMSYLGVDCAALGYPASHARQYADVLALASEIAAHRLDVQACCAARTVESDIAPIAEISQRAGIPMQVGLFIGSSPIRKKLQNWSLDDVVRLTEKAVRFAVEHGLSVMYVTEDTTRSSPEALERLYTVAIENGASRVCVADTVGYATPSGATNLVSFVKRIVERSGAQVGIDWHGHSDRGLALANSLAAWAAGAERCHGTALGIGERSGNAAIEQLLANLVVLGKRDADLAVLPAYVRSAATALGFHVPPHQPLVGRDAFRTATGTHAAAILRAEEAGDPWLAERIYSGVPAGVVGREQVIEIGPLSGEANVLHWLGRRGITPEPSLVSMLLEAAKHSEEVLDEPQVLELVEQWRELSERGVSRARNASAPRLVTRLPLKRPNLERNVRGGAR